MAMQHSRDRCHHVVFLNLQQGHHKHTKTQGGFKFRRTCQECSNSFVKDSHSVLQFRYPDVTQETREWTLPVVWSTWERTFPLRAVPIVFFGQFDVFISPHFVAAPWSTRQINSTLEVTDSPKREQTDSGWTPFCNKAFSTSSCLIPSKAPSTSAEATKAPTPHSAALLSTCLNVAVTPAVDLPGS